MPRRRPFIATTLLLPVLLAACGTEAPTAPAPPSAEALSVVVARPGADRAELARAVDALFTAEGIGETRALLVLHDGEVVAQRYAAGFGPDSRFQGWSMSKTVTALLIGLLVSDGRLALDGPAPVPLWQRAGDPRGEITVRHLLQMRSGLKHQEMADPVYESAEVRMMFGDGRDDMAAWAEAQVLEHAPGTTFTYSTPTSVILSDIAARVLAPDGSPAERQAAVSSYLQTRLAVPLGLRRLTAEHDRQGTMVGGAMVWATAADWARLGELLRREGVAATGTQVLPRGWVELMRDPSPASPDYGGALWLNRPSGGERQVLFPQAGPADLFALVGHLGQYVLVAPGQELTVVRLGKTDQADRPALVRALADLVTVYR
ncbi:serine hydrolase domain-containing protein [Croceibacterium ferulae]|uniref:serine hydrolase domain-containing protein n=1 Tax=Croceibacterium ferulae TaxID=1854641 RepID=UPI000EB04A87|nr:serine hydrolase domain-containing protein [Croceibacterium ferulae]